MARVRILLDEREVFSGELQPLKNSTSGKSVILAQDSSKMQAPVALAAFDRIGWSFTMYGLPKRPLGE